MVGPYGDWVQYDLEGAVHLAPEVDGVRILTADRHELLRRVPDALQDVFSTGSTSPGQCCRLWHARVRQVFGRLVW